MLRKLIRFRKDYFSPPFLVIFCLGLLMLILGLRLTRLPESAFWYHGGQVLEVLGTAFIAVALSAPISEFFQFRTLSQRMGIVRGAQDSGITHILKSRLDEGDSFKKMLHSEFEQADIILLTCIAFPEALGNLPYPKAITDKMASPRIPVRILLLDPKGKTAKERKKIEIGRATVGDIEHSVANLGSILRWRAREAEVDLTSDSIDDQAITRLGMRVHLYDSPPSAFMFITDECLLLEQYHLGRLPGTREGEPIGCRVPLFRFAAHSLTYKIMKEHFEYVWEHKSRDVTEQLLKHDVI